jgi:putative RNA 2'-phosphotransferase
MVVGTVVGAGVEGLPVARGTEVSVGVFTSTRRAQDPANSSTPAVKAAKQRIGFLGKGGKCTQLARPMPDGYAFRPFTYAFASSMASPDAHRSLSKFLSLVLRHQPATIGLTLDEHGWVSVTELLAALNAHGKRVDRALLEAVVADNDKQRFAFSPDGQRIRANQGHSVAVELGYTPQTPPETLYHGTAERNLASIRAQGLLKQQRHHVHLSANADTARQVGQRYGRPVVLVVNAGEMSRQGHTFYQSDNGVWLTDAVPPQFIQLPA